MIEATAVCKLSGSTGIGKSCCARLMREQAVRSGTPEWSEFGREEPTSSRGSPWPRPRDSENQCESRDGKHGVRPHEDTPHHEHSDGQRGGRPPRAPGGERRGGEEGSGEPSSRLTSSGADKVTVGELRLRGRRI